MKLAGLDSSAVIGEIMNKDGTMARLPELLKVADELNIKISSIELLINYINSKSCENFIKLNNPKEVIETA